jgi:hypothetical protein
MSYVLTSNIMRTTIDIDDPILREVKAVHEKEGRSMGAVVSELLAEALARRRTSRSRPVFRWTSRAMKALVDLSDKDAVYAALDGERR